jgi:hypothetical protein
VADGSSLTASRRPSFWATKKARPDTDTSETPFLSRSNPIQSVRQDYTDVKYFD